MPIRAALRRDLKRAQRVQIISAYFLPPTRLRRALQRAAARGASVQLILPGLSDVPLLQAASRSLYARLLRAGVQIFEYAPQILHSKFIHLDQAVYLGSANLDPRSLGINYDFLVRLAAPEVSLAADAIFAEHLHLSRAIDLASWRRARTLWTKIRERLAFLVFARIDPFITRRQFRNLG